jgi:hypothetical protein
VLNATGERPLLLPLFPEACLEDFKAAEKGNAKGAAPLCEPLRIEAEGVKAHRPRAERSGVKWSPKTHRDQRPLDILGASKR